MAEPKMPEKDETSIALTEQLTDDQIKLLNQSIDIVKQRVFSETVKKFRNYVIGGVSLVTLFGVTSVVNIKTAIKDSAVSAFREDASLRQSIKDDASAKVTQATELISKIEKLYEQTLKNQQSEADATKKELVRIVKDVKEKRQEDNLLFEHSAKELNDLAVKLKKLIEAKDLKKWIGKKWLGGKKAVGQG